jgi:broad specificity phosphatase PhoE
MNLVLLRHEERYESPLFFTSLTEKGLINSEKLVHEINKIKLDVIYSSPFLRTIQTIRPYCLYSSKKIRVDYCLYEYIHANEFTKNNYKHHVTELEPQIYKDIIDDYCPILQPEELNYKENEDMIKERVYNFIKIIEQRHIGKTVLIVSHMSTLNMIKNYYDNKTQLEDPINVGSLYYLDKQSS